MSFPMLDKDLGLSSEDILFQRLARSDMGHWTESIPIKEAPLIINGKTKLSNFGLYVRPEAAHAPLYFIVDNIHLRIFPPT